MIIFTIFLAVFISSLFYFLRQRYIHFQLFCNLGIPGPKPNYIYGSLHKLRWTRNQTMIQTQDDWYSKYGPIYGYFAGVLPNLVVHDLDILKDILIKKSAMFINRPRPIVKTKPVIHTLVGLRGQRWKDVRSVLTPTFSGSKMRQMSPLMSCCISDTLGIIDKLKDTEFDIVNLYQGLTCQVISKCALAMEVNCQKDPGNEFLSAVKGFLAHALNPLVFTAICFPFVGTVLGYIIDHFAVSGKMTTMICENVTDVLDKRRQERARNPNLRPEYSDVLQLMMEASSDGDSLNSKQLTDDEIIANCWVFVLGGFETTSTSMAFTTYLLAMHQDIQERLFQELESGFGLDEIPTYEQLKNFVYLDQVISETLRLYPPVVNFITREVEEPTEINQYVIPANVNVYVPIWQIHHDPANWPDPYKFDPERFNQTNRKTHHSMAWIPFGVGPRNCIGSRFGLMETKLAIARIFRNFKFLPSEHTEETIELAIPTVVITPKNGIHLRCERRYS